MKVGREIDYHGSRIYGANVPELSWSMLLADWLAGIVTGKLRRRKPSPQLQPPEATFTLLGVSSRVSRRTHVDPFPVAPGKNDNGRGGPSRLRNED